jgi:hypothetical protein
VDGNHPITICDVPNIMDDMQVVKCSYSRSTKVCAKNASAYLCLTNPGNGNDRIVVIARSRSGRWVMKWEPIRNLERFRCKNLPSDHPRYADDRLWTFDPDDTAIVMALSKFRITGSLDG